MKKLIQALICLLVGFLLIAVAETTAQPSGAEPTYYWFDGPHAWAVIGPFDQWYGVFEEKAYPIGSARDPHLWRTDVRLGPAHFRLPVSAPATVLLMLGLGVAGVVGLSVLFRSGARTKSHVASKSSGRKPAVQRTLYSLLGAGWLRPLMLAVGPP